MHGTRFLYTEDLLRQTSESDQTRTIMTMMPAMVMSAFASELFLKCLLLLEGQTPPDLHHLGSLYKRLHNKRKARIAQLWDAEVAAHANQFAENERRLGVSIPRDLKTALFDCGDAFEGLRYIYEDPLRVKFYIIHFAPILHRAVLEVRPDWRR